MGGGITHNSIFMEWGALCSIIAASCWPWKVKRQDREMVKMTKSCLAVFSHTHTNVVEFANSKLQLLSVYAKNDDSGVRKLSTCTRFTSWKAYTCVGLHILKPRVPGCALSTSLVCVTEWRQAKSAVCGIARWLSKLTLGIGQSVEHFGLQLNQVGPSAAELRLNTISSLSPFRDLDVWPFKVNKKPQ